MHLSCEIDQKVFLITTILCIKCVPQPSGKPKVNDEYYALQHWLLSRVNLYISVYHSSLASPLSPHPLGVTAPAACLGCANMPMSLQPLLLPLLVINFPLLPLLA